MRVKFKSFPGCLQDMSTPFGLAINQRFNSEELYFFNRMALSIYTELGMIKELSTVAKHRYCLGKANDGNRMTVVASTGCPAVVVAQVTAKSSPENRQFKLIPDNFAFSNADECFLPAQISWLGFLLLPDWDAGNYWQLLACRPIHILQLVFGLAT